MTGRPLIVGVDRRRRHPAHGPRVGDVLEVGCFVPRAARVFTLGEVEDQLHRIVRHDVAEERVVELAHLIERLHEHVGVGDLTGQQMNQGLLGALVVTGLDQGLVGLAGAGFGGDVRPQIANDVAALLDIGCRPATSLAVKKMRAATFELEQRRIVDGGLVDLAGVRGDQLADHLEVAELLDRDVLEHVANAGILNVEGLDPVLQCRGQFAGGTPELLQGGRCRNVHRA